jgi:hypothetical protein
MNESDNELVRMAVEQFQKEREAQAKYTINKLLDNVVFQFLRNNDNIVAVIMYEDHVFSSREIPVEEFDRLPENVDNPDWEHRQKIHDWRNHIPETVQKIWKSFTTYQKWILAKEAQVKADEETWE